VAAVAGPAGPARRSKDSNGGHPDFRVAAGALGASVGAGQGRDFRNNRPAITLRFCLY
jgi:uncharacterized protein (DUF736 family)